MKKLGSLLWQFYMAVVFIFTGAVILILFFMWFPDFISWYSGKIAGVQMSFIFEIIPIAIMVGGISVSALFLFRAVACFSNPEKEAEK